MTVVVDFQSVDGRRAVGSARRLVTLPAGLLLQVLPRFGSAARQAGNSRRWRRRVMAEDEVAPAALLLLLQYAAGEWVGLTEANVVDFVVSGRQHGLQGDDYEQALSALEKLTTPSNACALLAKAARRQALGPSMVARRAAQRAAGVVTAFVLANLSAVTEADAGGLAALPAEQMRTLLRSDGLRIESEAEVLALVLRWLEHAPGARAAEASAILAPLIRWSKLPYPAVKDVVAAAAVERALAVQAAAKAEQNAAAAAAVAAADGDWDVFEDDDAETGRAGVGAAGDGDDPTNGATEFAPSAGGFAGAKAGYKFQIGGQGLGYYVDRQSPHWAADWARRQLGRRQIALASFARDSVQLMAGLSDVQISKAIEVR